MAKAVPHRCRASSSPESLRLALTGRAGRTPPAAAAAAAQGEGGGSAGPAASPLPQLLPPARSSRLANAQSSRAGANHNRKLVRMERQGAWSYTCADGLGSIRRRCYRPGTARGPDGVCLRRFGYTGVAAGLNICLRTHHYMFPLVGGHCPPILMLWGGGVPCQTQGGAGPYAGRRNSPPVHLHPYMGCMLGKFTHPRSQNKHIYTNQQHHGHVQPMQLSSWLRAACSP